MACGCKKKQLVTDVKPVSPPGVPKPITTPTPPPPSK